LRFQYTHFENIFNRLLDPDIKAQKAMLYIYFIIPKHPIDYNA